MSQGTGFAQRYQEAVRRLEDVWDSTGGGWQDGARAQFATSHWTAIDAEARRHTIAADDLASAIEQAQRAADEAAQ